MKSLVLLLAVGSLCAAAAPRLFYSRSFPGSKPAYFQITLGEKGDGEYAEAADDSDPLRFQLSPAELAAVNTLVEKVDYCRRPLESQVKVAFMGAKTIRYDDGQRKGEAKFNYTEDASARELVDWFERMGEAARDRIDLERTARFDKLGVYQAVLNLQSDINRKRIAALEQFLPILDKIIGNETYMHAARQRAAEAAELIRKGATK